MVNGIVQAISGSATGSLLKGNATAIGTQLSTNVPFKNLAEPDYTNATGTNPKAYLSVIFFDERFNVVTEGSISKRVLTAGPNAIPLSVVEQKAPKNGYCIVYVSNESDEMVYFDNLQVTNTHARIIEENHYYAYGLKIAAISSKKLGDVNEGHLENNYQYQGDYSDFDDEVGWNDFELRNYDLQLGRWIQQDPYQEFPSPYTGMGNDPVNNVDPTGGFLGLSPLASIAVSTLGGAIIGGAIDIISGGDGTKGLAIGAGVGLLGSIGANFGIGAIAGGVTNGVGVIKKPFSINIHVGRTITVGNDKDYKGLYYKMGGHVGIEIDNKVYHYYYENPSVYNPHKPFKLYPGKVHQDKVGDYSNGGDGDHSYADGDKDNDGVADIKGTDSYFKVDITKKQYQRLSRILLRYANRPELAPKYGIFGKRCTSMINTFLRKSGIRLFFLSILRTFTPHQFYNSLKSKKYVETIVR